MSTPRSTCASDINSETARQVLTDDWFTQAKQARVRGDEAEVQNCLAHVREFSTDDEFSAYLAKMPK